MLKALQLSSLQTFAVARCAELLLLPLLQPLLLKVASQHALLLVTCAVTSCAELLLLLLPLLPLLLKAASQRALLLMPHPLLLQLLLTTVLVPGLLALAVALQVHALAAKKAALPMRQMAIVGSLS